MTSTEPTCAVCPQLDDSRRCGVCGDVAYLVHIPGLIIRPEPDHRYACQMCRTLGHGRWSPAPAPEADVEPPDPDMPEDPRDRYPAWTSSTPPPLGPGRDV